MAYICLSVCHLTRIFVSFCLCISVWRAPFSISCFSFLFWPQLRTCSLTLEGGEGREKERGRNIHVREKHWLVASRTLPDWDQICNPGTCPEWELNPWPFHLGNTVQATEPHWSGLFHFFKLWIFSLFPLKSFLEFYLLYR